MLLPTHKQSWRDRWSTLTDAVEALLCDEEPDIDEALALLRERQSHLVAFENIQLDDSDMSLDEQQAWANEMLERDELIQDRISKIMSSKSKTLESYQANKRALKTLRREKITPQRNFILTGHL